MAYTRYSIYAVARKNQKGKTNLNLLEQERVSGRLAAASAGPYANPHLTQTHNHASIPPHPTIPLQYDIRNTFYIS